MDPYHLATLGVGFVSTTGLAILLYSETKKSQGGIRNSGDSFEYHFSRMENNLDTITNCLVEIGNGLNNFRNCLNALERSYNRLEKILEEVLKQQRKRL